MKLSWIHRTGNDRHGNHVDRHYLVDELSRRVLGEVDAPEHPYLCYRGGPYEKNKDDAWFTDLDTAKAYVEAQAMLGVKDRDYTLENLEEQYGVKDAESEKKPA